MLAKALAIECQAGERRDDVRVAEEPHVEEEDRPEERRLDHNRGASRQRPDRDDGNQREVELGIPEPAHGWRVGEWRRGGECTGRAGHAAVRARA